MTKKKKLQPSTPKSSINIVEPIAVPEWLILHKAPRGKRASQDQSKTHKPASRGRGQSDPSKRPTT
ncbi:MAG TPA: hypothetical protein VIG25_02470 [Pyrinomonadaceae bacterium]